MNIHNDVNYIYLLQEREFTKTNENIYKVGMTKQKNFKRFYQYPKGSILLHQMICGDASYFERKILKIFKNEFIHRKDIGNEYFECKNFNEMIDIIYSTIRNGKNDNPIIYNYQRIDTIIIIDDTDIPIIDNIIIIDDTIIDNTMIDNQINENTIVENTMIDNPIIDNTIIDNPIIDNNIVNITQEASTISSKSLNTYICDICDYKTNRKHNYTIHLSSDKHIKQLAIKNRTFTCDSCQYSTNNRCSYDKHMKTVKHKMNVVTSNSKKEYKYNCELCNFHSNKKCNYDKHLTSNIHKTVEEKEKQNEILHNTNLDTKKSDNEYHKKLLNTAINNDTLDSIMSEIKTLMVEQNKMNQIITEMANKPVTIITNNNNNNHHINNLT